MSDNVDLQDRITVKINGADVTLFMSAQMRNRLVNIFQAGEYVEVDLAMNASLQQSFVVALMTPKNPKAEDVPQFEDLDMSIEDYEQLVKWASEHVLDFFMRAVKRTTQTTEMLTKAYNLLPQPTGSKD